ncbi:MAG: MauE/DoxX family redox-associated membrane protein [Jatrophihabitans sp.]
MLYVAVGCRAALALVFALSVAGKLVGGGAFEEFSRSIVQMKAVPVSLVGLTARAVVAAEALILVLIIAPLPMANLLGCLLAGLLTLGFCAAIIRSIRSGNRVPCRCFGRSSTPLGGRQVARNAVLLAVTVLGAATASSTDDRQLAAALVAVIAGLFVGLLIASFDDIAELIVPA